MGLVLRPGEVKSGLNTVLATVSSSGEFFNETSKIINNFAQNEALKSESWNTAKSSMVEAHQAIGQGMKAAHDIITRDVKTLEQVLGDEDLDEEQLIFELETLTRECMWYEEAINHLRKMQANGIIGGYEGISDTINCYKKLLETTKEEIEILQAKLNYLKETAQLTADLFQSVGPLLQAVQSAINDAEVYISGTGELSDGSWKVTIPKYIDSIDTTPEIVTKEMLMKCGWDAELLNEEMLRECNRVLDKYEINTPARLSHFIAQCSYETGNGESTFEVAPNEYFEDGMAVNIEEWDIFT